MNMWHCLPKKCSFALAKGSEGTPPEAEAYTM